MIFNRKMTVLSKRRHHQRRNRFLALIFTILLLVGGILFSGYLKESVLTAGTSPEISTHNDINGLYNEEFLSPPRPTSTLGRVIDAALLELGIPEADIHITRTERINGEASQIVIRRYVDVPPTYPLEMCNLTVTKAVEKKNAAVLEAYEKKYGGSNRRVVNLKIAEQGVQTHQVILREKRQHIASRSMIPKVEGEKKKIAFIIDDFGPSLSSTVRAFLQLNRPLTISILPYYHSSKRIAKIAHREGKEILLHLPMEPEDFRKDTSKHVILSVMTQERVQTEVHRALKEVPHAIGVNNHMGSKVTTNPEIMTAVMQQLHEEQRFFIDSMTSNKSIAWRMARNLSVPTAKNQLFLDDEVSVEHTQQRIADLAQIAADTGYAIGIGHPHHSTLKAIQEMIPALESKGYELVFVSSLVK